MFTPLLWLSTKGKVSILYVLTLKDPLKATGPRPLDRGVSVHGYQGPFVGLANMHHNEASCQGLLAHRLQSDPDAPALSQG